MGFLGLLDASLTAGAEGCDSRRDPWTSVPIRQMILQSLYRKFRGSKDHWHQGSTQKAAVHVAVLTAFMLFSTVEK